MAQTKYQMYQEVIEYGNKSPAEIDPTGALLRNMMRAQDRVKHLRKALKAVKRDLNEYLKDHKRALAIVKRMRAVQDKTD